MPTTLKVLYSLKMVEFESLRTMQFCRGMADLFPSTLERAGEGVVVVPSYGSISEDFFAFTLFLYQQTEIGVLQTGGNIVHSIHCGESLSKHYYDA